MSTEIKKFDVLLSLVYLLSVIMSLIGIFVLILLLIGNNTVLGKNYDKINTKLTKLVEQNVLNEKTQEQVEKEKSKEEFLYGHPWLMIILIAMTTVTAIAYVIKGIIYIFTQRHENYISAKINECLKLDVNV